MSNRSYNHVYEWRRIVVQIILNGPKDGLCIDLLPAVSLGFNRQCAVAIGFEWLCGSVNFGWMTKEFKEREHQRMEIVKRQADKLGISTRQQELRWGW